MLSSFAGALVGVGIIALAPRRHALALPFGTFLAVGALVGA